MSEANSTLSALVSTPSYLLAYSIPLLLVSVPLTFAGTFLTLDRSRSFPASYASVLPGAFDSPRKKFKFTFSLQGGVGGLVGGYVFGVHLSTFFSVLIPSISTSSPLSSGPFFAVWILSCIFTTVMGGRYRYCARVFEAICGGSLLALAVVVIIHPPLLPRQILIALFATLCPLLIMIFSLPAFLRFLRPALRVATASSGAFSMVVSIALIAHIPAWADIWERLWVHDGDSWGTSKEKGLSAAYCTLLCAGIISDWALKRWLGECPDEKWDNYLANYSANLPNESSRAGKFRPLPDNSLWNRLFHPPSSTDKKDVFFPLSPPRHARNSMAKDPTAFLSDDEYDDVPTKGSLLDQHLSYDDLPAAPAFLKKARSQTAKFKPHKKVRGEKGFSSARKRPIKFGADLSSDSSDDDMDGPPHRSVMPWLKGVSASSSSPTLVDESIQSGSNSDQIKKLKKAEMKATNAHVEDYSDYEEDLGAPKSRFAVKERDTGWTPNFMKRHSSSAGTSGASGSGSIAPSTSTHNEAKSVPMGAVPATPSLINALDRISAAQKVAFPPNASSLPVSPKASNSPSGWRKTDELPQDILSDDEDDRAARAKQQRAPRWEEFWREVKHKAETSS